MVSMGMVREQVLDRMYPVGRPRRPDSIADRDETLETLKMLDERKAAGDRAVLIPHLDSITRCIVNLQQEVSFA